MKLIYKPMGAYQTNCFIVQNDKEQIIIDPGVGATSWIKSVAKKPVALLNTHGHFDHIWSNQEVKNLYDIPIYCPKDDAFMLENDPFYHDCPPSKADIKVDGDESFKIAGFEVKFFHFPGHTPGCSAILIDNYLFSGDFVFKNSIGRVDFPFSSPDDMKKSIKKFLTFEQNFKIYPGHGGFTYVKDEQKNLPLWLNMI